MNEVFNTEEFATLRAELSHVPGLDIKAGEPLERHTRFGIGGPADLWITASGRAGFIKAFQATREAGMPLVVIGGGSNLIVSDRGFPGVVLRYGEDCISCLANGNAGIVTACAGLVLQDVVDQTVAAGLKGLETMTGIPGWLGAAIYGNAGAYGHSISEIVLAVDCLDGSDIVTLDNASCQFHYRESVFKKRKNWIVLGCTLQLAPNNAEELKKISHDILSVRNQKYPPSMKCAGSIFKNFLFAELPARVQAILPGNVVREGKVPSAWFLEQAGAKGLRIGDIQVADYHANLIYNDGAGTARDLIAVIQQLKKMVGERFDLALEEEVQYVGSFV